MHRKFVLVDVQRQSTPATSVKVSIVGCAVFPDIGSTVQVYNGTTNKVGQATVTSYTPGTQRIDAVYTMADGAYDAWTT